MGEREMSEQRRASDKGIESNDVILARIDERVKNISDKLVSHMVSFETHKVDDEGNFKSVNRLVWIGVGIISTLQVVGVSLIAIFHK